MKSKIILTAGLVAGLLIAISASLIAGQVTLPNTFTAGTPAVASDVNANFNAVANEVNDNAVRITTLEATVTGGNLVLEPSTATAGNVMKGADSFIHNFGTDNAFIGLNAGNFTLTGQGNTASGAGALRMNTGGDSNTASGARALESNTTGNNNTANGVGALLNNRTGGQNTANGVNALLTNTTGSGNIAVGFAAGVNLTDGSNNIYLGNQGVAVESSTIRVGDVQTRAFIAGISGVAVIGAGVLVSSTGQLG